MSCQTPKNPCLHPEGFLFVPTFRRSRMIVLFPPKHMRKLYEFFFSNPCHKHVLFAWLFVQLFILQTLARGLCISKYFISVPLVVVVGSTERKRNLVIVSSLSGTILWFAENKTKFSASLTLRNQAKKLTMD